MRPLSETSAPDGGKSVTAHGRRSAQTFSCSLREHPRGQRYMFMRGNIMKNNLTRRSLVKGGTALATVGMLTGPALLEWAKAWAQTAPWKPERGAQLSLVRPTVFVPEEYEAFVAAMDAFALATGTKITIARESSDDLQPKASVAANTGAGPDLFLGYHSLPHLFPQKCLDVTDVAEYLGKKYGGWAPSAVTYGKGSGNKWIDIPVCYTAQLMDYRIS